MDKNVKAELVASGVSALGVPLVRAALNHHYTMKEMDRQEEMQVKIAERRSRGLQAMTGAERAQSVPQGRQDPVSFENPGDVYDELENLRSRTDCGFCHDVIGSLMDASPGEAKQGYEELRSYVREVERIKDRDLDQGQAEEIVSGLADRWEVVPKHAAGMM